MTHVMEYRETATDPEHAFHLVRHHIFLELLTENPDELILGMGVGDGQQIASFTTQREACTSDKAITGDTVLEVLKYHTVDGWTVVRGREVFRFL